MAAPVLITGRPICTAWSRHASMFSFLIGVVNSEQSAISERIKILSITESETKEFAATLHCSRFS